MRDCWRTANSTTRQHEGFDCHAFKSQSTGGMRPDASENSQITPSTIVRASRAAGRHPHLASVLLQGRKSANIHASTGVIRGIPVNVWLVGDSPLISHA